MRVEWGCDDRFLEGFGREVIVCWFLGFFVLVKVS